MYREFLVTRKKISMDPCWKHLPIEIVEKICNFLPQVRRIDENLSQEIRDQTYKFDMWFYNMSSLFGFNDAYYVMYDDLINVLKVKDDFPEEMPLENVVLNMWKKLTPEERVRVYTSTLSF